MKPKENPKEERIERPNVFEKRLDRLVADGRSFLKSCGLQLEYMSDRGLLSKGGLKVQKHIQKYQDIDLDAKAIIAFIGESGAGKSTLLNALLDYEKIVPTSGIKACTSVATEFSRREPGMNSPFYAVIEYVDKEEFEEEASILREDIVEGDNSWCNAENIFTILSASEDDDSEGLARSLQKSKRRRLSDSSAEAVAKVARDKLKALFPGFQTEDIGKIPTRIQDLYNGNEYLSAGKQIIEDNDEETFFEQIQELINNNGDGGGEEEEPQLWPLIKVVKIYLDADVLQTGAVLVDLPGLKDSNAARAAVSQTYLARANEVIVVSRLTRVMTDETTAALAEMGYSKQLQYDGRKQVTIVCSFCDVSNKEFSSLVPDMC
ncbi:hypothetical protein TWF694_011081 [Orbilia ellipsospora]|uniref:Dynamin N-terminal domain-containing protein n=1 Tax=Orbilia ellipsospora TaxID=2528407 RepID=A0AAV9XAJ0_9PEZI